MRGVSHNTGGWAGRWVMFSALLLAGAAHAQLLSGSALRFNGTNQYVSIPHNAAYNVFPFTVSAWMRSTSINVSAEGIVSKYVSAGFNGFSMHTANGRLRAWYFRDGANFIWNPGGDGLGVDGGFVADGRWHYVTFSVDQFGGRLFVDGVFKQNMGWSGTAGAPSTTAPLHVAAIANFSVFYRGDVDEVRLWNYALTNDSVNYVKFRQLAGNEDGLVSYWRLDEGMGTTVTETSPAARTGNLIGGPQWVDSTAPIALSPVAGSSVKLDGINDEVLVNHAADLNAFPLTITSWVRTSRVTANYDAIVNKYESSSANGYSLHVLNGRVYAWYFQGGTNRVYVSDLALDGGFIADGQFHHIAFVVDSGGGRIFVDGVQRSINMPWNGVAGPPTAITPVRIGRYPAFGTLLGQVDEVAIWNRSFTAAELQAMQNLPLAGNEANLIAYWPFNEGSGLTAPDFTGNGHTATLQNGTTWAGSIARLGDGSVRTLGNLDWPGLARRWEIQGSPQFSGFPLNAPFTFRRFHDYGSAPAPLTISATVAAALSDHTSADVPLEVPAQTSFTFLLPSENANAPATNSIASFNPVLNLDPAAQLASVSATYAPGILLAHTENEGDFLTDDIWLFPLARFLDFNGQLFFGTIETRFTSVASEPTTGGLNGSGLTATLTVNNNSGYLATKPTHRYGNGSALGVTLYDDGRAEMNTLTVNLAGPVPDAEVHNGITFWRTNLTLNPFNGIRGNALLRFPAGFSVALAATNRITSNSWMFSNVAFDPFLIPQAATFNIGGTVYGIEETKPFWMQAPSLTWDLNAGTLTLDAPLTLHFLRQREDDVMLANQGSLVQPTAAQRISNDGYFRNITTANGPAVIRGDANGAALLTLDVQLPSGEFRPHFPYTPSSGPGLAANGGRIVVSDDVIDTVQSAIQILGTVPVSYARDCLDTNCAGAETIGAATMAFTPNTGALNLTGDGGLLAYGTVPPQNLTWGYYGGGQFAQRTSDVDAGAFQMAGTFLRGDATTVNISNRAAVLLLTGNGDASDPNYLERPGQPNYASGFANYSGLNFRAPAEGRSYLARFLTDWYPLIPEAKYYVRAGGVNGIHQAASFPANLTLYGYKFTFARYALSYLDSENWQSRTDGSVHLPGPADTPVGPAGFDQEFAELKLLCRGGLGPARVPEASGEKYLNYWNTYFTPLSFEFRPAKGDTCGTGDRKLVLGAETKLPFIPQKFHASLGFQPNGNLVTVADNIDGTDSRFPIPAELSLDGPSGGRYRITSASEGYFNNWAAPGRPDAGFYNIAGRLDLPFFQDTKVHLHVVPLTRDAADVFVMGGWRAAEGGDHRNGWLDGTKHFFNTAKFDPAHRGFPTATANQYRNSSEEAYHPRAEREWLEIVKFDYPLMWNKATHRFASFKDSLVTMPVLDVNSRLKDLTPGIIDIDFSQDINLGLPRIKLLDFANDAIGELNKPLLSVSNAVREAFTDLADASGINKGFRSMQRVLRDTPEALFRPILDPALEPAANALYTALAQLHAANPAAFLNQVSNSVFASSDLRTAVQSINGATDNVNSVLGSVNSVLTDLDDTIGLFIRIVQRDGSGQRRAVRIIIQKIVKDQGPELGFAIDLATGIADEIVNDLLGNLEPTLAEIERQLVDARAQLNQVRSQLAFVSGDFNKALASITSSDAVNQFGRVAGGAMRELMKLVETPQGDFFTANPADAKRQIKQRLLTAFFNSTLTSKYQETFKRFLYDDNALVNQLTETLFQQVNVAIRNGLQEQLTSAADGVFKGMKGGGFITDSLLTAKIRGAPTFEGDAMRKIRLDTDVKMNLPDEMTFGAFLQILELDSSNTPIGCMPPGGPSAEVTIGATRVPLGWLGVSDDLTLDVSARWNLNSGRVYGVGGAFQLNGSFDLKGISIDFLGAALAVGEYESYFAARAKGRASAGGYGFGAEVGFFAGRTCRPDPLLMVDPDVGKIVPNPGDFAGLYVQFGGVFPLTQILGIPPSCLLRLDGVASTAFYYQGGPRGAIGGRQTVGVDVDLICFISASIRLSTFLRVSADQLLIGGEAEVCGEIGFCPFCVGACFGVTVIGTVTDGDIDYEVDF